MTSSLVGSEMCIRDRDKKEKLGKRLLRTSAKRTEHQEQSLLEAVGKNATCLLYTSDAADDM
eukprot:6274221-Prorocentrum_lima.AAC.1